MLRRLSTLWDDDDDDDDDNESRNQIEISTSLSHFTKFFRQAKKDRLVQGWKESGPKSLISSDRNKFSFLAAFQRRGHDCKFFSLKFFLHVRQSNLKIVSCQIIQDTFFDCQAESVGGKFFK